MFGYLGYGLWSPQNCPLAEREERLQLSATAKSRTLPHSVVARAKVVLWSVEGENNTQIAARLQWTKATGGKWRKRFIDHRLAGLYDELRPGRPRTIEEDRGAALLKRTLSRKPREPRIGRFA